MSFIAVLDYGIGNLRSAQKALVRAGGDARLVTTPQDADGAAGVVLPGVGSFGACMEALRDSRLDEVVFRAISHGTPFLGICVGLQMLYGASEESPGVRGLGVLPGDVRRMSTDEKLPQMQWNRLVEKQPNVLTGELGSDPWCYFVHSYAVPMDDNVVATCDYGVEVPAVVSRLNVSGTQFHPEKSSEVGLRILGNFVAQVR